MALEIGQRYVGLRAKKHDGKLLFVSGDGECEDELQIGSHYVGLLAKTHNGKKFYVVGDQKLNEDGELILGKRYRGLLSGTHNGKKLYTVSGKQCEEDPTVEVCGIEVCCAMDASVSIMTDDDPETWSTPVDVSLECGGIFEYTVGYQCVAEDITIPVKFSQFIAGKDTLASPEPYDTGSASGTRSCKSVIWSGDEFEIEGDTYKLTYWKIEYHVYQTLPTVVTTEDCVEGFVLQKKITSGIQYDVFGEYWEAFAGTHLQIFLLALPFLGFWTVNLSNNNPNDPEECPEGYENAGGELEYDNIGEGFADIDFTDPCE